MAGAQPKVRTLVSGEEGAPPQDDDAAGWCRRWGRATSSYTAAREALHFHVAGIGQQRWRAGGGWGVGGSSGLLLPPAAAALLPTLLPPARPRAPRLLLLLLLLPAAAAGCCRRQLLCAAMLQLALFAVRGAQPLQEVRVDPVESDERHRRRHGALRTRPLRTRPVSPLPGRKHQRRTHTAKTRMRAP